MLDGKKMRDSTAHLLLIRFVVRSPDDIEHIQRRTSVQLTSSIRARKHGKPEADRKGGREAGRRLCAHKSPCREDEKHGVCRLVFP
jgi:hypothetical protein